MESKRHKVMKMIPITPWSMDRISQLPQAILHHILCFLSQKEAVRTSVLSKSWRYLWSTLPNIEFRERYFPGNKKTFLSILDKTLQGYHDKKLCIQEFYVEIWTVDSESSLLLEKWIPIVTLNKRLKTFKLCFVSRNSEFLNMARDSFEQECFQRYFDLPSVVFEAESLEELYLQRCKLSQNPLDKVLFTHLQTLILKRVYIEDETFQKIMSSCPLIENLVIHSCMGLKTIKVDVFHKYLKYFDFHHHVWHSKIPSIEIDIPTLETIKIEDYPNWFRDNRHKYFSHLKSLYLNKVRLSTMSFDYLSRDFPCLEELTLYGCKGIEEFQLSSRSIKHLSIVSSYKSIKAAIAAPNIVNFKCSSNCLPSISFTTNSSEWKSHIHVRFDCHVYDASSWFHKLNELLKELSQSEISLEISRYSSLTNQQVEDIYGCFYEPVVVKHLSLNEYSCSSSQSFLNCLFRICRPIYIRQYMYIDPHAEFVCKNLLIERESRHQDLEEVNMEAFDDNGQEWHCIPDTSLSERALPNEQKIRFRLKWR